MTNSSSPSEPPSSQNNSSASETPVSGSNPNSSASSSEKKPILDSDERVALIVAFGVIGTVLWGIIGGGIGFNFKNFDFWSSNLPIPGLSDDEDETEGEQEDLSGTDGDEDEDEFADEDEFGEEDDEDEFVEDDEDEPSTIDEEDDEIAGFPVPIPGLGEAGNSSSGSGQDGDDSSTSNSGDEEEETSASDEEEGDRPSESDTGEEENGTSASGSGDQGEDSSAADSEGENGGTSASSGEEENGTSASDSEDEEEGTTASGSSEEGEDSSDSGAEEGDEGTTASGGEEGDGGSEDEEEGTIVSESDEEGEDSSDSGAEEGEEDNVDTVASNPEEEVGIPLTTPQSPQIQFSDISQDYWATPFINPLRQKELITGFEDGTFQPDTPVTRADFAIQLSQMFEKETAKEIDFQDVSEDYVANAEIDKAVRLGFMKGYSQDEFRPDQRIPRYQVLVALVTGLNLQPPANPEAVLQSYEDIDQLPDWASKQIAAATQAGLVVSHPNVKLLNPNQPATRAEVAAMLHQALVKTGKLDESSSDYIVPGN